MRIPTIGIRGRITLLACVAFGVAVVLGAVVLVWAVRDAVERSLDDRVRAAAGAVAAQNRAAAFAGPRFEPIEIMPIDSQAAKTDRRAGHEIDAHRRDPGAIRGNGLGHPLAGGWLRRELESHSD